MLTYHLVTCCTDNIVDGVVSPALIASDSIWAVAVKALQVDRFVSGQSGSSRNIKRAIEIGYTEVDMAPEHVATTLHHYTLRMFQQCVGLN